MRNNVYLYQMQCINKVQQWFFNSFNNSCMLQKQMVWEDGRTVQMLEYFAFGFQVYMQYCGICIRYNIPFSFK